MGPASAVSVDMPFQADDSRRGLSRRECIGVIGATSVSPFLTEKVATSGGEYANVVDIVEAGADNSGEVPIDDVFERPPVVFAQPRTYNGANTANLRYRHLDETGVEVFVEEERSADDEVGHVSERVGVLVVDVS